MTLAERQQLSLVSVEEEEELTDVRQLSRSVDQTCASHADKGWFPETATGALPLSTSPRLTQSCF